MGRLYLSFLMFFSVFTQGAVTGPPAELLPGVGERAEIEARLREFYARPGRAAVMGQVPPKFATSTGAPRSRRVKIDRSDDGFRKAH